MEKRNNFSRPVNRTIDELSVIADVGLDELEHYSRSCVNYGRRNGEDTREWEEELCYIQREREIRETRKLVHKQWMEEYPQNDEWTDAEINKVMN